ncbi:MAG: porin family protein [Bacteroidales bacterium]
MKRIALLSVMLICFAAAYGQRIKFSVHADPQFAWFSSDEDNVSPAGSILHMQAGLIADLFFSDHYAFTTGVGVNNMGGKLAYADSTLFVSGSDSLYAVPGQVLKHRMQYIDIPLGLKLKTEELGYTTFFFQLGFNPMFNINAFSTSDDETFDKENNRGNTNLFNLGYHLGAGVQYRLGGSTALVGGVRWSSGLTDVTGNDEAKITLNAISINLGVQF